ncbi:MAG: class I SAM-dependent methyltransferase, partial [Deltaproteobacteria bacterium]|nr:class I SAM-dependent methyltransferase [Deltaproteobacteria bacterium]
MEQKSKNIIEVYNQLIFPIWQRKHSNLILKLFDKPRVPVKALEINCRNGYLTYELAKRVPDKSSIIAIDPSRDMLNYAMEATLPFQNVIYFKKDSELSNFDKGVFDYVFLSNSNINKHSKKSIEKIKDYLTAGGAFAVTFINKGAFREFFDHFLDIVRTIDEEPYMIAVEDAINNLIGEEEIPEVFSSFGLDVIRTEKRSISISFESGSTIMEMPYFYFIILPVFKYSVSTIPNWEEVTNRVKDLLIDQLEKLKKGEFSETTLKAIINNLKVDKIKERESNQGRAY